MPDPDARPDPPQKELTRRRQRHQRQDSREPVPWLWLFLGLLVTVGALALVVFLARDFLEREPLTAAMPSPTIIRLTAPPTAEATPTPVRNTPTPIPTLTPVPTLDLAAPPDEVQAGYYAMVVNTGGNGVTVRAGPSTSNARLLTAAEGRIMLIVAGPEPGDQFEWYQVRLEDGTEGWVAGDFLELIPAPTEEP